MSVPPEVSTATTDLENQFHDIQIRASENWSFVQALRECFAVTLPTLRTALIPYLDQSVRTTMGTAFPPISNEANQQALMLMAAEKERFAQCVVDAATIAIIQATLDSAVNQYLELLAQADPAIWEADISKETVRLGEAKAASYEALLSRRAVRYAKAFASKSLSKKVQKILDLCYRDDVELSPREFRFDVKRLKAFDDTRHDVAHGRGMGIIVSNMDELLLFLWRTLLSLEDVIASRLGFQRDPGREFEKARELQLRTVEI